MAMETQPMPLDELSRAPGGLDEFRVSAPSEILSFLRKLCAGSVAMNLVGADGASYVTTVWAVDGDRDNLVFSADLSDEGLQGVIANADSVAVGYLDNIKIQFDTSGLVVTRHGKPGALSLRIPSELYRFQRRDAYRVRPLARSAPTAHLRHPDSRDRPLEFRVLDLSIGGCALFVPDGAPAMKSGMTLDGVHIDLDGNSTMRCSLLLHHVVAIDEALAAELGDGYTRATGGLRIGCELLDVGPDSRRTLQRFIDQTQQRRRNVMSL